MLAVGTLIELLEVFGETPVTVDDLATADGRHGFSYLIVAQWAN